MDPLTLGIIGVAALVAFAMRKREAPEESALPKNPGYPNPTEGQTPAQNFVAGVGGVIGVGGLSAGLVTAKLAGEAYLAAKVGAAATGDKGTGVIGSLLGEEGAINPLIVTTEYISLTTQLVNGGAGAYAFNGGRVIGRELDQAFGGTGQAETGTVAQAGLGITAMLVSVGSIFAVAFFFVTAIVYAIGSAISDSNRLAYGQAGALKDYEKKWLEEYYKLWDKLHALVPELSYENLIRFCYPFTDGLMMQMNTQAYYAWMKRGRGLTVGSDDTYHALFGYERGYFVGEVRGGGLVGGPAVRSDTEHYYQESMGVSRSEVLNDNFREVAIRMGKCIANVNAYAKWMKVEPHGAFVDDSGHFEHGLKNAHFQGFQSGDGGGKLVADGFTTDADGNTAFAPKLYDWKTLGEV